MMVGLHNPSTIACHTPAIKEGSAMYQRFRWASIVGAVLLAGIVGVVSYNAGVSHGLVMGATQAGATPGMPMPYGWYRPWGFGFPFVFVLFWLLLFRGVFWGGFHRRRWYYPGPYGAPPSFEEWHRRAHERMSGEPPAQAHGSA
jgi:hypothetical protein